MGFSGDFSLENQPNDDDDDDYYYYYHYSSYLDDDYVIGRGIFINGGTRIAGCSTIGHPNLKWMTTGGTPMTQETTIR